ncbi:MAG: hypothetical protein RMK19_07045 [Bacteroidia bacterium]|nr:hypothetical protein [Bacteroidia bacterium]MDW8015752.1 hypothetical protein [Bacteroidia bacterium]
MHVLSLYSEKAQRDLLYTLFTHTDLLERLTGLPKGESPIEKDPVHGLFAFRYQAIDGLPIYIYFRVTTLGNPRTGCEQIREQASFIHRNREARYYALLLREAWIEWTEDYVQRRLQLPMHCIGYEKLLSALAEIDLSLLPLAVRQEVQTYLRCLQKEYEGLMNPTQLYEDRLRQYALLWHLRAAVHERWRLLGTFSMELDVHTQPHVHSSYLDVVFLRQYPPYKVLVEGYQVNLLWELEKGGLFLRVGLPPMREKVARLLHSHLRRRAQSCLMQEFIIGRTRGTLKGVDAYRGREVTLLRIELPEFQSLFQTRQPDEYQNLVGKVADQLILALQLLPVIRERVERESHAIRL